jgi:error-prone DNA polymerase
VWARIGRGETVGAFQVESRGQISKIVHTRPGNMDELAIQIALVRPGPAVAGSMHLYVQRRVLQRQGRLHFPVCEHPLLEPVLGDTLGVMVFQDQVMEVCKAMAGFTDGQADQLRRAMSRKRSAENMEAFRELFMTGAAARCVEPAVAESVFTQVLAFSGYGFPKSHAAAFAVLAYQTAFLLHYHPAEYVAAILNEGNMGFYSPDTLIKDAGRRGIRFLPPCVNRSEAGCTVRKREVRLGLQQVKGLGETGAEVILAERERAGDYQSVADFVRRTRLPSSTVEVLAQVGALDLFGENRRELIWEEGLLVGQRGVGFIHEGVEVARQTALALPTEQDHVTLAKPGRWERMAREYAHLGLSVDEHPLRLLRRLVPPGILTLRGAMAARNGSTVLVAGMVTIRQRPQSANGILFLSLEDETGSINVVVPLEQYEARRETYRQETLILIRGQMQRRERERNLVAAAVWPLTEVLPDSAKSGLGRRVGEAVGEWEGPPTHSFH